MRKQTPDLPVTALFTRGLFPRGIGEDPVIAAGDLLLIAKAPGRSQLRWFSRRLAQALG